MRKKKIWHVYYGTRGTAGSYIDALQNAASKAGLDSTAFVSTRYRYKTKGIRKIFFPFTEHTEKRNLFIKAVRFFEVAFAYKLILLGAILFRPIVNVNLIDDLHLTYSFFKLLKFFNLTVWITCHDVLSHHKGLTARRSQMFTQADRLIVHSSYAYKVLSEILEKNNQDINKIMKFPFPSSPYQEILSSSKMAEAKEKLQHLLEISKSPENPKGDYYLFIGIVRKSKGIDTLADAWQTYQEKVKNSGKPTPSLVVAGKWSQGTGQVKKRVRNLPGCLLIDRYLGDEEFIYLIQNARFVILPYKDYAHSAILFACAWNRAPVIISDAQLFDDIIPSYKWSFPSQSTDSAEKLALLIEQTNQCQPQEIEVYKDTLADAVKQLNIKLEQDLKTAYAEFL